MNCAELSQELHQEAKEIQHLDQLWKDWSFQGTNFIFQCFGYNLKKHFEDNRLRARDLCGAQERARINQEFDALKGLFERMQLNEESAQLKREINKITNSFNMDFKGLTKSEIIEMNSLIFEIQKSRRCFFVMDTKIRSFDEKSTSFSLSSDNCLLIKNIESCPPGSAEHIGKEKYKVCLKATGRNDQNNAVPPASR